jgi:hypothetical protein
MCPMNALLPATRDWAYQALREITSVRDLPNEPEIWRERLQTLGLL